MKTSSARKRTIGPKGRPLCIKTNAAAGVNAHLAQSELENAGRSRLQLQNKKVQFQIPLAVSARKRGQMERQYMVARSQDLVDFANSLAGRSARRRFQALALRGVQNR